MTNSEKFKNHFGLYATELWCMSEEEFVEWLNSEVNDWILVSERLPEKYGWYLCTLKDGRVNCYYWDNKGKWLDNGKKHFFYLYDIRGRITEKEITPVGEGSVYWTNWVIAWMPLPEPYREEGD